MAFERPPELDDDVLARLSIPHDPANGETYYYPYRPRRVFDVAATYGKEASWDSMLGSSCRQDDGNYYKPGFDTFKAIWAAGGPVLEIGGPTGDGYALLLGPFPAKPVVTNRDFRVLYNITSGRRLSETPDDLQGLVNYDDVPETIDPEELSLHAMANVHNLRLSDGSVGMILCSAMNSYDSASGLDVEGQADKLPQLIKSAITMSDEDLLDSLREASPLLETLVQARRVLKPSGLLVMGNVENQFLEVAQLLGFELVAHTPGYALTGTSQNTPRVFINGAMLQSPNKRSRSGISALARHLWLALSGNTDLFNPR